MRSLYFLGLIAVASSASALKYTDVTFPKECTETCKADKGGSDAATIQTDCFDKVTKADTDKKCTTATVTFVSDGTLKATACEAPAARMLAALPAVAATTPRLGLDLTAFLTELTATKAEALKLVSADLGYDVAATCKPGELNAVKDADACAATDGTAIEGTMTDSKAAFDKLSGDLTDAKSLAVTFASADETKPCEVTATADAIPLVTVTGDFTLSGESPTPDPSPAPSPDPKPTPGAAVSDASIAFAEKDCKAPEECTKIASTADAEKCLKAASEIAGCKTAVYERTYTGLAVSDCAPAPAPAPAKLRRMADIPETAETAPKFYLDLADIMADEATVTTGSGVTTISELATGKAGDAKCDTASLFSLTEEAKKACDAKKGEVLPLTSEDLKSINFKGTAELDETVKTLLVSLTSKGTDTCTLSAADKPEVTLKASTKYDLTAADATTTPKPKPKPTTKSGAAHQLAAAGIVTLAAVTLF